MIFTAIYAASFECFNEVVQLVGVESEHAFYLTTSINPNCNNYNGQVLTAVLNFQDITLPQAMTTTTQTFSSSDKNLIVKFQLDHINYESVKENPTADFVISFENQFFYPGTIPVIQHTIFDSRHCWDDVEFSVDYDFAFNISVIPLSCEISSQVLVYLEYYNETWIQIPIVPTVVVGGQTFNGFQTGAFDTESVFFYNTSSDVDTTNADLIINFVKFIKLHLNTQMRFRMYESDPASVIKQIYQVDITQFGNSLSKSCHPLAAKSNLQTWYSYTTVNPNLIVDCLQSIVGGVTLYARQYTYDEDEVVSDHSVFSVELQKFRTRLGIPFYFANTIKVNESKDYYFITMIELHDANGMMLQALYYTGTSLKSCYYDIATELYNSKICLKIFTKDNPTCRSQLSTTGITGSFSGKLDPDPADPTKRLTYFWMGMSKVLTSDWFNSYQRICFTDANDTGEFQGTRVTGSFQTRMTQFFDEIEKEGTDYTLAFISDTELFYSQKIVSLMTESFNLTYYVFGAAVLITAIMVAFAFKQLNS
ncbi:Conserved_hypothetical protein [Hexamita inflata]|uniref:Uncharacterized protein n=1 Tax=Hexamita inflata TaxID=28002 RepID=A0AA86V044_9EUKA|nr:Conserved hypothetical protein [Hexamita inflata]